MLRDHVGDLDSKVYLIAGPPGMVDGVADALLAARVPEQQVIAGKFSGY